MLILPHLILQKDNKILLTRRAVTQKLWSKHWHCVTGTIEKQESPKQAIIREAYEEISVKLEKVNLVTTIFTVQPDYFDRHKKFYGLELFFTSDLADQIPINVEPTKQDAMNWFDIDKLPQPMIPSVAFGLKSYFAGLNYAEFKTI